MKESKSAALKAKGWKTTSTKDFLGLSEAESKLIDLKIALSDALAGPRKMRQLTQVELAKRLHTSQSRVAKMEGGDPSVSMELLMRAHFCLGATPHDVAAVISQERGTYTYPMPSQCRLMLVHEGKPAAYRAKRKKK